MADAPEFADRDQLKAWLDDKPPEWAQAIAVRAALRVLPVYMGAAASRGIGDPPEHYCLMILRALSISWAARTYPAQGIATYAAAFSAAEAAAIYAAYATTDAADAAVYAADVAAAAATDAATDAAAIWDSASTDAAWLEQEERGGDGAAARALVMQRLWLDDVRGDEGYNLNFPPWARSGWDQFNASDLASAHGFDLWMNWYKARLRGKEVGGFDPTLTGDVAETLDVHVATQPEAFWGRDAEDVNAEIRSWIEEAKGNRFYPPTLLDAPVEPSAGPGPQYGLHGGKISELASQPVENEADRLAGLHRHLRRDARVLSEACSRVANRYPEFANATREYSELIDVETAGLDVTAIWSVGGAIANFSSAYQVQNVARTLSEPLEPNIDALLRNVVRQHGAFIMGFAEGRDLVERADQFAVDRARLEEIEAPGQILLSEFTDNKELVDERTRALHRPVRASVTEFGWVASRSGYSAYLIVRNAVRAMIKFSVGSDPNLGAIAGILLGGSALAGDPNAEFIRAAVPVLQQYGSQLTAFFNHSPEMRAYVEWALKVLDADSKKPAHKPQS